MFLSKRSNGVYYLWFDDELGRRHKVSTRCTLKTDALKFIQQFKQAEKQKKINRVLLSQFTETSQDWRSRNRAVLGNIDGGSRVGLLMLCVGVTLDKVRLMLNRLKDYYAIYHFHYLPQVWKPVQRRRCYLPSTRRKDED
jgi:hypothetical protein